MSEWIPGIDVSHHQGKIDWRQVAGAGIKFAWCKASQGTRMVDGRYLENIRGAQSVGILVSGYHFGGAGDPVAEAAWFVAQGLPSTGLPPVLDLESPGMDARWAVRFLTEVERRCGMRPMFYGNASYVGNSPALAAYALWLPRYPSSAVDPDPTKLKRAPTVGAWERWTVWQYTSTGRVPGISGNVDRNVGDAAWFASLTHHGNTASVLTQPLPLEEDMTIVDPTNNHVYALSSGKMVFTGITDANYPGAVKPTPAGMKSFLTAYGAPIYTP